MSRYRSEGGGMRPSKEARPSNEGPDLLGRLGGMG
jgi:hypothetical protein